MMVGILGGGQLALMLGEAAEALGHRVAIFVGDRSEPAAQRYPDQTTVGSLQSLASLQSFVDRVDVVVYESDFLPFERLRTLRDLNKFCPSLSSIERVSDKLEQKAALQSLGIPTADFMIFDPTELDAETWFAHVRSQFWDQFVLKWSRGGYDGKGTWISHPDRMDAGRVFLRAALESGRQVFAEQKIVFRRELSQISVCSKTGGWGFYPLVISEQPGGICRRVYGPAARFGVEQRVIREAQSAAQKVGESFELYGTFALELFETSEGFVVNEIAPRVHNTGHFSVDAAETSQFANHILAVTGSPLGPTGTTDAFFMHNLLGDRDLGTITEMPPAEIPAEWSLKWYHKRELKRGRKMGHINVKALDPSELESLSRQAELFEKDWFSRFL